MDALWFDGRKNKGQSLIITLKNIQMYFKDQSVKGDFYLLI